MLFRSDWRLSQSVESLIVANTLVSFANLVMLLLTLDEISLIKTRKSTGPSTVPCGTPLRTPLLLLTPPGILTQKLVVSYLESCLLSEGNNQPAMPVKGRKVREIKAKIPAVKPTAKVQLQSNKQVCVRAVYLMLVNK